MEKLLKRALIIIPILIIAIIAMAIIAISSWIAGDFRSVALYIGIMFVLFGLMIFTYRYTMFPDEGVEDNG